MLAAGTAPLFIPAHILKSETAPSNQITLGVVGVGAQGTWDMRAFLAYYKDVRVTAICDVNKKNITRAQKYIQDAYGNTDLKVFTDYRKLHADSSIDAVLMALPVHWHGIVSQDAILQGKHIYHEKPMALSLEEGRRIRDAVKKKGVVFQFGTQQRSSIYFRWACELALNGRLGKLKHINVCTSGGLQSELFERQPVPEFVDWDQWVGPAPMTPFNEKKLERKYHEHITNFSLGMISCWGVHHLDIAQWGNGTDVAGPSTVQGTGHFPKKGSCDAILDWKVHFEFPNATDVTFVSPKQGIKEGVTFVGESDNWVYCTRGVITAGEPELLRDSQNKCGKMPIKLPVSNQHTRNFIDAIKTETSAICNVDTAMSSDVLCQIALIAVQEGRKLQWDPKAECFVNDKAANQRLKHRTFRGNWTLA